MTFPPPPAPQVRRRLSARLILILAAIAAVVIGASTYLVVSQLGDSQPPAAADVAQRAGCGAQTVDSSLELYVREGLHCQISGQAVHVVTFAGNQQRDDYLRVAKSFGGNYVVGDFYLISVDSPSAAAAIAKTLGASVA